MLAAEGLEAFLEKCLVDDGFVHHGRAALDEGLVKGLRIPHRLPIVLLVVLGHGAEDTLEARAIVGVSRWEVRAPVEDLAVRGEKRGEGPSARSGQGAHGLLVPCVHVGPLVTVDLDRDELLVDDSGEPRVLVRLSVDHVAPVAPRGSDVQEDGAIELLRLAKRLVAPRMPVHGLVRGAPQVRGGLLREAVRLLGHVLADRTGRRVKAFRRNRACFEPSCPAVSSQVTAVLV